MKQKSNWAYSCYVLQLSSIVYHLRPSTIVVHWADTPGRSKYVERFGEAIVVNKASVNGEDTHEKDQVASTEKDVPYLHRNIIYNQERIKNKVYCSLIYGALLHLASPRNVGHQFPKLILLAEKASGWRDLHKQFFTYCLLLWKDMSHLWRPSFSPWEVRWVTKKKACLDMGLWLWNASPESMTGPFTSFQFWVKIFLSISRGLLSVLHCPYFKSLWIVSCVAHKFNK